MRIGEIAKANALFLICVGSLMAIGLTTMWGFEPPENPAAVAAF